MIVEFISCSQLEAALTYLFTLKAKTTRGHIRKFFNNSYECLDQLVEVSLFSVANDKY